MRVSKIAARREGFRRPCRPFERGRAAFKAFLVASGCGPGRGVLLPAYVGWSPSEGSGVFDPVRELGLPYDFYRMDPRLHIDMEDLTRCLQRGSFGVVVVIHYFGYVDPSYAEAVSVARSFGALVLEDEAHAMLTDLVGGACGRLGDACIFSQHKLLPVSSGGMLVVNSCASALLERVVPQAVDVMPPWEYDLAAIAERRRHHARLLAEMVGPLAGNLTPLWAPPDAGEVPQTYPMLVSGYSRDALYHRMNEAGFGVVGLYHTLIDPIGPERFPESHALSRCIINLPVHQDLDDDGLRALVCHMGRVFAGEDEHASGRGSG